jgi:hypothetical protein
MLLKFALISSLGISFAADVSLPQINGWPKAYLERVDKELEENGIGDGKWITTYFKNWEKLTINTFQFTEEDFVAPVRKFCADKPDLCENVYSISKAKDFVRILTNCTAVLYQRSVRFNIAKLLYLNEVYSDSYRAAIEKIGSFVGSSDESVIKSMGLVLDRSNWSYSDFCSHFKLTSVPECFQTFLRALIDGNFDNELLMRFWSAILKLYTVQIAAEKLGFNRLSSDNEDLKNKFPTRLPLESRQLPKNAVDLMYHAGRFVSSKSLLEEKQYEVLSLALKYKIWLEPGTVFKYIKYVIELWNYKVDLSLVYIPIEEIFFAELEEYYCSSQLDCSNIDRYDLLRYLFTPFGPLGTPELKELYRDRILVIFYADSVNGKALEDAEQQVLFTKFKVSDIESLIITQKRFDFCNYRILAVQPGKNCLSAVLRLLNGIGENDLNQGVIHFRAREYYLTAIKWMRVQFYLFNGNYPEYALHSKLRTF